MNKSKTPTIVLRLSAFLSFMLFIGSAYGQELIQDGTDRNYNVVNDQDAHYPDGQQALHMSFYKRMHYPASATAEHAEADVTVAFFVEADSTTGDVKAMNDPGHGFPDEAVRLIKETKFAPALQNGKPIRQQMMLRVLFRIYD